MNKTTKKDVPFSKKKNNKLKIIKKRKLGHSKSWHVQFMYKISGIIELFCSETCKQF